MAGSGADTGGVGPLVVEELSTLVLPRRPACQEAEAAAAVLPAVSNGA